MFEAVHLRLQMAPGPRRHFQYRLHDSQLFAQVYDYVDDSVLMPARMYERRLKGYAAIGYVIEQETFASVPPAVAHP